MQRDAVVERERGNARRLRRKLRDEDVQRDQQGEGDHWERHPVGPPQRFPDQAPSDQSWPLRISRSIARHALMISRGGAAFHSRIRAVGIQSVRRQSRQDAAAVAARRPLHHRQRGPGICRRAVRGVSQQPRARHARAQEPAGRAGAQPRDSRADGAHPPQVGGGAGQGGYLQQQSVRDRPVLCRPVRRCRPMRSRRFHFFVAARGTLHCLAARCG